MVMKSTIPVKYTKSIREKRGNRNALFSPRLSREPEDSIKVLNCA